jgi:hypothetical protein
LREQKGGGDEAGKKQIPTKINFAIISHNGMWDGN